MNATTAVPKPGKSFLWNLPIPKSGLLRQASLLAQGSLYFGLIIIIYYKKEYISSHIFLNFVVDFKGAFLLARQLSLNKVWVCNRLICDCYSWPWNTSKTLYSPSLITQQRTGLSNKTISSEWPLHSIMVHTVTALAYVFFSFGFHFRLTIYRLWQGIELRWPREIYKWVVYCINNFNNTL